jgi:CRISPR-associated exonuclease Cas4
MASELPLNELVRPVALYDEESLLPISALQHLMFCERQWALIHLEQIWEENVLTAKGRQLHERVDTPEINTKGGIKITRSLRLRSLRLGLTGIADVVEFHCGDEMQHPYPIEYKRGKPKKDLTDIVQLCAQALCLEDMLQTNVPQGALFYGETKRRLEIDFNAALREETLELIKRLHQITRAKKTPSAKYEKKCENCSLINWCLPTCTDGSTRVSRYVNTIVNWVSEDGEV